MMRRLMTFILGMVVGGVLLYGAQQNHLIRAKDGFHLVPKVKPQLAATYVDIRNFTVSNWAQHADVAMALVAANQGQLMENSAADALRTGVDRLLDRVEKR